MIHDDGNVGDGDDNSDDEVDTIVTTTDMQIPIDHRRNGSI